MKPPRFWFKPKGLQAVLLSPLSRVWLWAGARRMAKTVPVRMSVPVICVGNINLGGTGKTPTVIDLLARLHAMGKTPHVVSRGYGGTIEGPVQVTAKHSAHEVGDEPILLSALAPVWVSKDRVAGAKMAVENGADCIVLDDGMQNPALTKDLTVLVIDAQVGFGNGCVFPSGPLRERIETGVKRANIAIAIGSDKAHVRLMNNHPILNDLGVLLATLKPIEMGMDWEYLRVFAFAGIGRPQKFYDTLSALGADVVGTRSFDDHEPLSDVMLQRLERDAAGLNAQLVTTEKDMVRVPEAYRQSVLALPVRLSIKTPEPLNQALKDLF